MYRGKTYLIEAVAQEAARSVDDEDPELYFADCKTLWARALCQAANAEVHVFY